MYKKNVRGLVSAHWLFAAIALCFGLVFARLTPPLWGIDETAHFARAYQIAHGDLNPPKIDNGAYGGALPKNLVTLWNYAKSDLLDDRGGAFESRQDVDSNAAYARLTRQHFSKDQVTSLGSAVYSPLAYAAPSIGIFTANLVGANIGQTLFMARIFSLLLYVVLIWCSLILLAKWKLKWVVFVVALLPSTIFQGSVVTADGLIIALCVLFASLYFRLLKSSDTEKDGPLFYALVGVAVAIPLVKINYILLSFALLALPARFFGNEIRSRIAKIASLILVIVPALIWTKFAQVTGNAAVSQRPDGAKVVPSQQIALMIHHPLIFIEAVAHSLVTSGDSYVQGALGLLGWNFIAVPILLMCILAIAIFFASVYAREEIVAIRKQWWMIGMLAVVAFVGVFAALYISFDPTGRKSVDGVQGRYFLPLIVPAVTLLASYLPIRINLKDRFAPYFFGAISAVCLLVSTVFYCIQTY